MAKVSNLQRKSESRRRKVTPHPFKEMHQKTKSMRRLEKKEWKESTCSVCMEYPHNAVLLLCSSYNKGCRPYMCATSNRYSNCLEQYKKAYTKVCENPVRGGRESIEHFDIGLGLGCLNEKTELAELQCPLCRGQVKGWTVVKRARKYFNTRRRTCMQDNCTFVGTYKELRKHVRAEHRRARTREVDPLLAEKWKKLEHDREREDVISTIRSSVPGAIVIGDYVIERNYRGGGGFHGDFEDAILRLGSVGVGNNFDDFDSDFDSWDEEDFDDDEDMIHRSQGTIASSSNRGGENLFSRVTRFNNRLVPGRLRRRRRHRVVG